MISTCRTIGTRVYWSVALKLNPVRSWSVKSWYCIERDTCQNPTTYQTLGHKKTTYFDPVSAESQWDAGSGCLEYKRMSYKGIALLTKYILITVWVLQQHYYEGKGWSRTHCRSFFHNETYVLRYDPRSLENGSWCFKSALIRNDFMNCSPKLTSRISRKQ